LPEAPVQDRDAKASESNGIQGAWIELGRGSWVYLVLIPVGPAIILAIVAVLALPISLSVVSLAVLIEVTILTLPISLSVVSLAVVVPSWSRVRHRPRRHEYECERCGRAQQLVLEHPIRFSPRPTPSSRP
jgi:hypothetical protein